MSNFSVPPGQEIYECQTFANPWGKQVDIKDYALNMGAGSHHMFAFYQSNATNGAIAACAQGGLTFAPYTFSAQSPHTEMTYPPTIGATLPATTGFMLNVHYINTGTSALPASVALTMSIGKAGVVTNHAGAIFLNQANMSVAATCTTASGGCQSTATYQLTQDVNIIVASSHMHKFATHFISNANQGAGVKIYETNQWSEPTPQIYCPGALHLASGTTIAWNIFYPVMDVTNPVIGNPAGFGVCLSPETPIATPDGERPVASLHVGDIVMSMDHGKLRPTPLVRVSHTPGVNHHVVAVTLANGRVLHVSEGHPTAEGRLFRDLSPGDLLGDEAVVSVQSIAYDHDATYDIEPASDTATYVAGGALIGSTLRLPTR
jgi:hypothetical protein